MPWSKDELKRDKFARYLNKILINKNLFRRVSENSLVIALDSGYGSGKSTFLKMWSDELENSTTELGSTIVIKMNAWLSDDYDNPLVPFIYSIHEKLFINSDGNELEIVCKEKVEAFQKASLNSVLRVGKRILNGTLEQKFGVSTQDIENEILAIKDDLKVDYDNVISDYRKHVETRKEFIDKLSKISEDLKIIVMIDELDRCKPTYAIETLEVVKHFFDVSNITYVFAVDIEQLSHSISTVYGNNMDANGYLRKFFDVTLSLPKPDLAQYLRMKKISIDTESSQSAPHGMIRDYVIDLAVEFNLSLRDVDALLPIMCILLIKIGDCSGGRYFETPKDEIMFESSIIYLFFMKYKHPNAYKRILTESFQFPESNSEKDIIPKSSLEGPNELKVLLSNGKNNALLKTRISSSSSKFEIGLFNMINNIKAYQIPTPRSIGQFLINFIDSSLEYTEQFIFELDNKVK